MRKTTTQRNVVRAILSWYKRQGRTLPWRNISPGHPSAAYRILLSEIMLQQTQVNRVLVKYPEFLRRFPSLQSLASAKRRDVILAWRGMGYNNRAVRLHGCARTIMDTCNGMIPDRLESLIKLPGIGKYTADALLASVHGKPVPVVEVNVQRVLSRVFWRMPSTRDVRKHGELATLASSLLPKQRAYDWNQALMDLGATVCIARNPRCDACPVTPWCRSRARMLRASKTPIKREPSFNGLPNRVYRGRIIEQLRQNRSRGGLRADVLAKLVSPAFLGSHAKYFRHLLGGLQKDGLIQIRGNGALSSTRILLG